ncbi:dUTP diphosphatase [Candidatus Atribacteria bacterium 1244-E10-H5-B2]|nr:MAG: dUTP diphosphatase [Candidatus Atribacteria bacterium 1244-E10-H5-B2]
MDLAVENNKIEIKIEKVKGCEDLPLPISTSELSSGVDLLSAEALDAVLKPGKIKLISTGIKIMIPKGYEGQIRPRSGLALKHGITVLNTPGTIDSDYRGIVKVILINLGEEDFIIQRGDRIAQLVIQKIFFPNFKIVKTLDKTKRGECGFGHSGVKCSNK